MNAKEGIRRLGLVLWAVWTCLALYRVIMLPGRIDLEARAWMAAVLVLGGAIVIAILGAAAVWIVGGFRK